MKNNKITEFEDLKKCHSKQNNISLPTKDVFCYIYEKAKEGNEMALMLLFEWIEYCSPKSIAERQLYSYISSAFNELFK